MNETNGVKELNDLVIVSAFGRGQWLANEFASRGKRVTLVDTTSAIAQPTAEDIEGPFGLFDSTDLVPSQKTFFEKGGEFLSPDRGIVFWLADGPIECRSELTNSLLRRRHVSEESEAYLRLQDENPKSIQRLRTKVAKLPFAENWLAHLVHQLSSYNFVPNADGLSSGEHAPVFSPFSFRKTDDGTALQALQMCKQAGVNIRYHDTPLGLSSIGRNWESLIFQDGREHGKLLLWLLSKRETRSLSIELEQNFNWQSDRKTEWVWTRFPARIKSAMVAQIPAYSVVVGDIHLPWTHENLVILRAAGAVSNQSQNFDIWVRIPLWGSRETQYLEKIASNAREMILSRIPGAMVDFRQPPAERVSQHPIHILSDEAGDDQWIKQKYDNVMVFDPENRRSIDWLAQFKVENSLLKEIERRRERMEARRG